MVGIRTKLGASGKIFFGSLCAGTFGLGCWQLDRLLQKWDAIDERREQLGMPPVRYGVGGVGVGAGWNTTNTNDTTSTAASTTRNTTTIHTNTNTNTTNNDNDNALAPYRRRLLRGRLRHDKEVLIGPRGAPPGVQLPVSGLSAAKNKNNANKNNGNANAATTTVSGMQPGPQGFYVLTPMEVAGADADADMGADADHVVWVNRGWVPKTMVPGANRPHYKNDPVQRARLEEELRKPVGWNRPEGVVELTAIVSKPEKPRFLVPEHDYSRRPLQLFWIDGLALGAVAADIAVATKRQHDNDNEHESGGAPYETAVVTQVVDDTTDNDNDDNGTQQQRRQQQPPPLLYPLQPPVSCVGAFKTTPAVHVGYAATWFGLSGAGWYMTRKLITKGRW